MILAAGLILADRAGRQSWPTGLIRAAGAAVAQVASAS